MKQLNKDVEKFKELNAVIFPILADNESGAKQLEESCNDCKIPIFFDEKKAVITPLHQEVSLLKLGRMPAVIIADINGTIQYAYFGESMSDIPSNQELLQALRDLTR